MNNLLTSFRLTVYAYDDTGRFGYKTLLINNSFPFALDFSLPSVMA